MLSTGPGALLPSSVQQHRGKALQAAGHLILMALVIFGLIGFFLKVAGAEPLKVSLSLVSPFLVFAAFTLYFFRDPSANVPPGVNLVVSPGHGTVDVIDETEELHVMGGRCRRISIFLSIFNVHVQQAPVSGSVIYSRHTPGQFINAMNTESAAHNENVLLGFDSTRPEGIRVGVRLIAGLIARRIIPWVDSGSKVSQGERISLIQFGSRLDLYLPLHAEVAVQLGQKVVGGETVMARFRTPETP